MHCSKCKRECEKCDCNFAQISDDDMFGFVRREYDDDEKENPPADLTKLEIEFDLLHSKFVAAEMEVTRLRKVTYDLISKNEGLKESNDKLLSIVTEVSPPSDKEFSFVKERVHFSEAMYTQHNALGRGFILTRLNHSEKDKRGYCNLHFTFTPSKMYRVEKKHEETETREKTGS